MKICSTCEKEIARDAVFCSYCGSPQAVITEEINEELKTDAPMSEATSTVVKPRKKLPLFSLIRNSFILLTAAVLVICAFLPISVISTDTEDISSIIEYYAGVSVDSDLDGLEFGINTIEETVLFFDSFKEIDSEELLESDVYEQLLDIGDELKDSKAEDISDLNAKEKRALNKVFYLVMRMTYQSEEIVAPPTSHITMLIAGWLFIIFAIAFFVVALLNLLGSLDLLKKGRDILHKWTMGLLCATPMAILATYYTTYMCMEYSISKIAVWSLLLSGLAIVLSTTFRYIFSSRDKKSVIVPRAIAIGLSIIVVCLAFAPIFKSTLEAKFRGRNTESEVDIKHNAAFFTSFDLTESMNEEIDELRDSTKSEKQAYFESQFSNYSYMRKKDAKGEIGKGVDTLILVELLGSKSQPAVSVVFSFAYIPFITTVIGALLVLWQSISSFATGCYSKKIAMTGKLLSAISCAVGLAFTVVFLIYVSPFVDAYILADYGISISAGIIALFIFAVGSVFCPSEALPRAKKVKPLTDAPVIQIEERF